MFYTIYKTTNKINGKSYIGKHKTHDLNDEYLGSGIYLNRAINKYGRENFYKEILFVFDNEFDMNEKEKELINEEITKDAQYYNVALGGYGGKIVLYPEHPLYHKVCEKISYAAISRKENISDIAKQLHKQKKIGMYGKKQTDKQKKIVSEIMKGKKKSIEQIKKQQQSLMKTFLNPNYVHPNTGKKKPTKVCEYCNREIDKGNFSRYHGKKCKLRYEDAV